MSLIKRYLNEEEQKLFTYNKKEKSSKMGILSKLKNLLSPKKEVSAEVLPVENEHIEFQEMPTPVVTPSIEDKKPASKSAKKVAVKKAPVKEPVKKVVKSNGKAK